jgi:hypothetical protein
MSLLIPNPHCSRRAGSLGPDELKGPDLELLV